MLGLAAVLTFAACSDEKSLEQFIVNNAEEKNFVSVDLSSSLLSSRLNSLSQEDKAVLKSFKKVNLLAYRVKDSAQSDFKTKWEELKLTVKTQPKYEELMRMGSANQGAMLYVVGDSINIQEIVLLGSAGQDVGFGVVRFLGDDMTVQDAMQVMNIMQRSSKEGGLQELEALFK